MIRVMHHFGLAIAFMLTGSVLLGSPAIAATELPFRIGGSVIPIAGPGDFSGANIQRMAPAQSKVEFTFVRYYVVTDPTSTNSYTFSLEATTGAPVAASEVAFDATGHRQLIAVGTPTQLSLQTLLNTDLGASATDVVSAPSLAEANPSVQPLTLTRGHDFFGTYWLDPVGLQVNHVVDEARFYYDGTHVSSLTGGDTRGWASWNGWWEVHHSIAAAYNSSHTLGWVQTNDHFQTSSWFPCGPLSGTTDVYYSVNRVYAQPNGHASGDVTTWQTGNCGFLLSFTTFVWLGS